MANFRRNKPRLRTYASNRSMRSWPAWHDRFFHTRPRRRKDSVCEIHVLRGCDVDDLVWPLNKKPHQYYW